MQSHTHGVPSIFGRIIAECAKGDREWFAQHPQVKRRTRKYVPGEFWPYDFNASPTLCGALEGHFVMVFLIGSDLHIRRPLFDPGTLPRRLDGERLRPEIAEAAEVALIKSRMLRRIHAGRPAVG